MKSRLILVPAVVSAVVGLSVSTPEAYTSPRSKTYAGQVVFPTPGGPLCWAFHSDGSFSFDLVEGLRTTGTWFEIGDLWFSFSSFVPPPGGLTPFVVMAGTTFEQDSAALNALAFFGFLDDPNFPLQPFVAAGHSGECAPPTVRSGASAKSLGKSQ